ncbi:MAG TPA: twin-arginine translocation signal domain-containing protein [Acidimicrobiales bacterium]|nr:twin-arginine translocation signal domain-containing protein [Acidimicrobiales bacterium]
MTVTLPRRTARRTEAPPVDLAEHGIHRDPVNHDPLGSATFSQRLVQRAAGLFNRGTTRRSFLTRTAVLGSALAVGPIDFILKPGSAYAYTCGTCSDGWTAFCCTINSGKNSCPPNSFVAGWWKADNAAYCCGAARYIIDCNATCPTQCACRCAGGSCDGRRTCCNQFRYGQCHTEIACYGPVVCRVATCTPPWRYDPSCTTSSATDNKTVNHGAPCLTTDCGGSAIDKKYDALGGAGGFLRAPTAAERANSDKRGRMRTYQGGNIYWTSTTGAHEVHGDILKEFGKQATVNGVLKYPTSDTLTSSDKKSRYNNFENGRIYYRGGIGTFTVPKPFFAKHESLRGVHGSLGYPIRNVTTSADKKSRYQNYEHGRIYLQGSRVVEIHGAVYTKHESLQGVYGPLGYPISDLGAAGDNRGKAQWFEKGFIWYTPTTGAHGLWGKVNDRHIANGHVKGYLRYPTSEPMPVGDGRGTYATFERGNIYASTTTAGFQVHGAVLDAYLNTYGGPQGSLGYPTSELDPAGTSGGRFQQFEGGKLRYNANGTVTLVS